MTEKIVAEQFLKGGVEGTLNGHLRKQCLGREKSPSKEEVEMSLLFMSHCKENGEENSRRGS